MMEMDPKYANVDEKKRKRMISNRESARRSRMKRQKHIDELIENVTRFKTENVMISNKIECVSQVHVAIESENNVLRAQIMELTDRLKSLKSVLEIMEDVNGFAVDIPEIPDILLESWHLPCPLALPPPVQNAFHC